MTCGQGYRGASILTMDQNVNCKSFGGQIIAVQEFEEILAYVHECVHKDVHAELFIIKKLGLI